MTRGHWPPWNHLGSFQITWDHLDHWRFRFRSNVMKCYLRYFYHVLAGLCTIRTAKRVVIRVVGSANRRRRCPAPNVYPQSNLYPICPPMCTHNMYPIHCTVCTLYSIFTSQPNKLRPTVKFYFDISFNIYLSQLVQLRGEYIFFNFCECQTLNLRDSPRFLCQITLEPGKKRLIF